MNVLLCLIRQKARKVFMPTTKCYDEDFKQSLVNLYQIRIGMTTELKILSHTSYKRKKKKLNWQSPIQFHLNYFLFIQF